MTRRSTLLSVLVTVGLAASLSADPPAAAGSLGEALREGRYELALRFRLESVTEDAQPSDSLASTLRSTLSYRSQAFHGFSLFGEFENVAAIGGDDRYRNGGAGALDNGVRGRPVIADPELTVVNQVVLAWSGGDTAVELGRMEIDLGNQRFVGAVGWRQHHQSFEALRVTNRSLANTTLTYAFLDDVHRIFGDRQPMSSHLLDAVVTTPIGKAKGYAYLLDYEDAAQAGLSTATYGAALDGARELGAVKLLYDLEAALQRDHADNPARVDATYVRSEVGLGWSAWAARVGVERLSGSPRDGRFTTPLATLHKWNGWADKFLTTPPDGLVDRWLALSGTVRGVALLAVAHDFSADHGSGDYGRELDLQVIWTTPWKQQLGLKGALYDADGLSSDTDKWMLWTAWSFGGGG